MVGQHPAKAALDIALLDLRARILGVGAATLLGGRLRTTVDAFNAVSVGSVQDTVDEARRLSERGYRRLQVKVGDDPLHDSARVRAVAAALPRRLDYLACGFVSSAAFPSSPTRQHARLATSSTPWPRAASTPSTSSRFVWAA